MCGIIGFSGVSSPNVDKLRLLMTHNALERGKDSTGIYSPSQGVIKNNVSAIQFLKTYDVFSKDKIFIGHVRSATIGSVTKDNAHPFHYGNTIMVHNGTLRYVYPLLNKISKNFGDFSVDSQILCYAIDKLQDPSFLPNINGAMALLWTDQRTPETLKVYRNDERPLHYGFIDKNMYISSIPDSLEIIGCEKVKEFEKNHVYTITNGIVESKLKFKEAKARDQVNTPYTYFNNVDKEAVDTFKLINRWVQVACTKIETIKNKKVEVFKSGEWYYCLSNDPMNDYAIDLIGEDGEIHTFTKHALNYENFNIGINDIVMAMDDIHYVHKNKPFCKTGDVVKVNAAYQDGDYSIELYQSNKSTPTKTIFIKPSLVRKLSTMEFKDYIKSISKVEDKSEVKPEIKQNCKISNSNMKSYINELLNQINEHIEKLKELRRDGKDNLEEIQKMEEFIDKAYFATDSEKVEKEVINA